MGKPLSYNMRPILGQWRVNNAIGKSKPNVFRCLIKTRLSTFYNVKPIFYRIPIIFLYFERPTFHA